MGVKILAVVGLVSVLAVATGLIVAYSH